jgi:hypothetical protein
MAPTCVKEECIENIIGKSAFKTREGGVLLKHELQECILNMGQEKAFET